MLQAPVRKFVDNASPYIEAIAEEVLYGYIKRAYVISVFI